MVWLLLLTNYVRTWFFFLFRSKQELEIQMRKLGTTYRSIEHMEYYTRIEIQAHASLMVARISSIIYHKNRVEAAGIKPHVKSDGVKRMTEHRWFLWCQRCNCRYSLVAQVRNYPSFSSLGAYEYQEKHSPFAYQASTKKTATFEGKTVQGNSRLCWCSERDCCRPCTVILLEVAIKINHSITCCLVRTFRSNQVPSDSPFPFFCTTIVVALSFCSFRIDYCSTSQDHCVAQKHLLSAARFAVLLDHLLHKPLQFEGSTHTSKVARNWSRLATAWRFLSKALYCCSVECAQTSSRLCTRTSGTWLLHEEWARRVAEFEGVLPSCCSDFYSDRKYTRERFLNWTRKCAEVGCKNSKSYWNISHRSYWNFRGKVAGISWVGVPRRAWVVCARIVLGVLIEVFDQESGNLEQKVGALNRKWVIGQWILEGNT